MVRRVSNSSDSWKSPGQRPTTHPRLDRHRGTAPGPGTAQRPAPPPPEWLIEHGIGTGRPPVRVHAGGCWDTRTRCKPATADQARRALAEGVSACPHCRPDTALGVLG
ncbi:DUF6233 domain-containing protein [Streptomyces lavendulae]|uniref:DUF6233 domain-containing protein n=1 Tax=Streptomyces lavendulae TaxID=1914 RepID=UPI003677DC3F